MAQRSTLCIKCKKKASHVRGMCQNCYHHEKKPRECIKCHKLAIIHAFGMCTNCYFQLPERKEHKRLYDQEYYRRPKVKEMKSLQMEEYRNEHAIELKNYIASYGQKPENKKNARLRLKRWRLTNLERQRKINRVSERNRNFWRSGKPVGPFDPNETFDENLRRALRELRERRE